MENTPLASDDVVLLIPVDTLVTVTLASATPASPLRADVVSFEANVLSEKRVINKNPDKRYFDLLNILNPR